MKTISQQLADFKEMVKNEITSLLENIYIKQYGQQPNWSEGEDIVLSDDIFPTFRVAIAIGDSSDNYTVEKWAINEYRVSLDENLFFRCGDNDDEFHFSEITTEELVEIYNIIKNYYDNVVEENYR